MLRPSVDKSPNSQLPRFLNDIELNELHVLFSRRNLDTRSLSEDAKKAIRELRIIYFDRKKYLEITENTNSSSFPFRHIIGSYNTDHNIIFIGTEGDVATLRHELTHFIRRKVLRIIESPDELKLRIRRTERENFFGVSSLVALLLFFLDAFLLTPKEDFMMSRHYCEIFFFLLSLLYSQYNSYLRHNTIDELDADKNMNE